MQTESIEQALRRFKSLADRTRLRALLALSEGELCACQLIELLDLAPSTVSHHMRRLEEAGLVRSRKAGKWTWFCWPSEEEDAATHRVLRELASRLGRDAQTRADRHNLDLIRRQDLESLCACYRN